MSTSHLDIRANGPITGDELFELVSGRSARVRVVLISDSCQSGTVARFAPRVLPEGSPGAVAEHAAKDVGLSRRVW